MMFDTLITGEIQAEQEEFEKLPHSSPDCIVLGVLPTHESCPCECHR